MSVTIIVEDGSVVAGANSYVSVANANTYLTNMYGATNAWTQAASGTAPNDQPTALYMACYAMERLYGRRYISIVPPTSTQSLLWPRYTMLGNDWRIINMNQIPQCLMDAQCELAMLYLQSTSLFPNESTNRLFKQTAVDLGGLAQKNLYWQIPKDVERYDGFRKVELILWPVLMNDGVDGAMITL